MSARVYERCGRGFVNGVELPKRAMNGSTMFRQQRRVLPKPGVRGSSPLRNANFFNALLLELAVFAVCLIEQTGR